jgi:TPR repeat protein/tRNA A-37 threonylcarbamoyl transferase component Bud32
MKRCPSCQSAFPTDYTHCPRDGSSLVEASGWSEGSIVRGKYQIISKVGQGGMAAVYKALHVRLKEPRALKVINPELASDANFVRRFEQEAIFSRKLQHPNAVRVDDIDEAEDGRPFIVMEYVEGENLKDVIEREAPLPVEQVCSIVKQVAAALDAAHRLGLVHRDIKPANVTLVASSQGLEPSWDRVKVLDFGIAKLKEAHLEDSKVHPMSHMTLTATGMVIGTPAYMSPEQAKGLKGEQLDGRSDIYSLGVVAYQMLTGDLPLKADSTLELLMAHISTPPKQIYEVRPDLRIPDAVAAIVMRCLEKNRESRPASGQALVDEIEFTVNRAPALPAKPSSMMTQGQVAAPLIAEMRAAATVTGYGGAVSLWAVAAILIVGALGGTWYVRRTSTPAVATTAEPKPAAPPAAEPLASPPAEATMAPGTAARTVPPLSHRQAAAMYGRAAELVRQGRNAEALTLDKEACASGNAAACTSAGGIYMKAKNGTRGVAFFRKGCEGGDTVACTYVGLNYEQGGAVHKDMAQAVAFYRKGCAGGDGDACESLGNIYRNAKGVPNDNALAVAFYRKACDRRNEDPARGCTSLGNMYERGIGVTQDIAKALLLYHEACDRNDRDGCAHLKRVEPAAALPRSASNTESVPRASPENSSVSPKLESRTYSASSARPVVSPRAAASMPALGSLKIATEHGPGGARVHVDGQLQGKTDMKGSLTVRNLSVGRHHLRLSFGGYQDYVADIDVVAGLNTLQAILFPVQFQVMRMHTMMATPGILTIKDGKVEFRSFDGKDVVSLRFDDLAEVRKAHRQLAQLVLRIETKNHQSYTFWNGRDDPGIWVDAILAAVRKR